jgi:hypothetical protein
MRMRSKVRKLVLGQDDPFRVIRVRTRTRCPITRIPLRYRALAHERVIFSRISDASYVPATAGVAIEIAHAV